MKKAISWLVPSYAMIPLISCMVINFLVYYGNRLIPKNRYFDVSIPAIDDAIPFWTWMVVFYVFSYVFWTVGFIVIGRESREVCYSFLSGEMIAKVFCLVFFLAFPTVMADWPSGQFEIENVFDWTTQTIYDADEPNNLFPSIHCLESWVVFRGSLKCKKMGNWYRVSSALITLAIFASTVFIKQHVVVDILGGVLVAELGFFLARKLRAGRIFETIERKLLRTA